MNLIRVPIDLDVVPSVSSNSILLCLKPVISEL